MPGRRIKQGGSRTDVAQVTLTAARKHNSKRPHPGWVSYLCQVIRKRVETTLSQISEHFARSIHTVTPRGFVQRGGVPYLVAFCHLDAFEKSFRLDRVRRFEIVAESV